MPGLFENLANNSGKLIYIDRQITNGLYLEDHANSISTELKINEKDWDYVILLYENTLEYSNDLDFVIAPV